MTDDGRTEELAAGLAATEQRILAACNASGRARSEVTLVVVTKTFPASDVRRLAGLGVVDVGESRDQEARPKAEQLQDLELRWHFVGRLQSNKARSVATYAATVHSVDRTSVVTALSAGATAAGRTVGVLVQVSLDGDPARGGIAVEVSLDPLRRLLAEVSTAPGLDLRGLMAVAPIGRDPASAFARLAEVSHRVRPEYPQAIWISAGMSGDLEAAVAAGATHLRVGSAILGSRVSLG